MLSSIFISLAQRYSNNTLLTETLWNELESNYSNTSRTYHTLTHLKNLFEQLNEVKSHINDWDTILFTMFYHDVIYNPSRNDNEEQSAEVARKQLQSLSVPQEMISKCIQQIITTKSHSISTDNDTNIFTDADLSILGQDWEVYSEYSKQIRKEYSIYSDSEYNLGRKNVIKHFLDMENIFKSDIFRVKYENPARRNLLREMECL